MQLRHDVKALEWKFVQEKQRSLKSLRTIAQLGKLGVDRSNSASPSDVTMYWNSRNAREMREEPHPQGVLKPSSGRSIGPRQDRTPRVKIAANFTWNLLIKANCESIFCSPSHTIKSRHNLKAGPELTSSPVPQLK